MAVAFIPLITLFSPPPPGLLSIQLEMLYSCSETSVLLNDTSILTNMLASVLTSFLLASPTYASSKSDYTLLTYTAYLMAIKIRIGFHRFIVHLMVQDLLMLSRYFLVSTFTCFCVKLFSVPSNQLHGASVAKNHVALGGSSTLR